MKSPILERMFRHGYVPMPCEICDSTESIDIVILNRGGGLPHKYRIECITCLQHDGQERHYWPIGALLGWNRIQLEMMELPSQLGLNDGQENGEIA